MGSAFYTEHWVLKVKGFGLRLDKRFLATLVATTLLLTSLTACSKNEKSGDSVVQIVGSFGGAQAVAFQRELSDWSLKSGVKAIYIRILNFDQKIKWVVKHRSQLRPDVVIYPKPGSFMDLGSGQRPLALNKLIDLKAVQKSLVPGWVDLGSSKGKVYGLPITSSVQSLIWYNPAAFKKWGYRPPTSDKELATLISKINADGSGHPWCFGADAAVNPGTAAGDWLEDYVLQYGGVDLYNRWWRGDVPFSDRVIKKAASKVASLTFAPGNVAGGRSGIAKTVAGAPTAAKLYVNGIQNEQCFMMRMGAQAPSVLPLSVRKEYASADFRHIGVFPVPNISRTARNVVGSGQFAVAFVDDADVRTTLRYLLSAELGTHGWAKSATFISAHAAFDNTLYSNPIRKQIAEVLANATSFSFDASELMPEVVAMAEGRQLLDWIADRQSLASALGSIDASWKNLPPE